VREIDLRYTTRETDEQILLIPNQTQLANAVTISRGAAGARNQFGRVLRDLGPPQSGRAELSDGATGGTPPDRSPPPRHSGVFVTPVAQYSWA